MADPKKTEGSLTSDDPYGVGMLANGKLNIVPPGELAARVAARNAEEAVENDDPEDDPDDVSDLEE